MSFTQLQLDTYKKQLKEQGLTDDKINASVELMKQKYEGGVSNSPVDTSQTPAISSPTPASSATSSPNPTALSSQPSLQTTPVASTSATPTATTSAPAQPAMTSPVGDFFKSLFDSPPSSANPSLDEFASNAAKDAAQFFIKTPIDAIKNTLGAGFEGVKTGKMLIQTKQLNDLTAKMGEIQVKMKDEKDPAKKQELDQQLRDTFKEYGTVSQEFNTSNNMADPFVDKSALPDTPGQLFTGVLKNMGRTFGITQDENGVPVFDVKVAIQNAYEHPVTTALMAKDLAGGVKNLAKSGAKDTAEVAGETAAKPGIVEATGNKMRSDVLNPQVDASPFYAEDQAAMVKVQEKLGLQGSAKAQLEQLPELFKKTDTEIRSSLAEAKPPAKATLMQQFDQEVGDANYNISDPQFEKAVAQEQKVLSGLKNKDATAYYEQMSKYRDLLKSTRKKIDAGTTLLPKEEARLAAFNSLKSTIDTVSPEVRVMNTLQNQMYNISEGLVKKSKEAGKPVQFLGTNVPIPGDTLQGAQDFIGRTLQSAPDKVSSVKTGVNGAVDSVTSKIPTGTGAAMATTNALDQNKKTDVVSTSTPASTTDPTTTTTTTQPPTMTPTPPAGKIDVAKPFGGRSKKDLMQLALSTKGLGYKELKEISDIYDLIVPTEDDQVQLDKLIKRRTDLSAAGISTDTVDKQLSDLGYAPTGEGAGSSNKYAPAVSRSFKQLESVSGIGTADSIFQGGTTSIGRAVKSQSIKAREATDATFAHKINQYKSMQDLVIGAVNQMLGAGTLQNGEAQRLLDTMPNQYMSEEDAKAWFKNARVVLGVE